MSYIRLFIIIVSVITVSGCDTYFWNPFAKPTPIDPCDPVTNIYEGEKHYIERDYLKEDGTLDYEKYFKSRESETSPCDPLKKHPGNVDIPDSEPADLPLEHTIR